MSQRALGPQFTRMRASELAQYAEDRTSDPDQKRNVDEIASSITKRGYRASQHDYVPGAFGRTTHIHLVTDSQGGFLMNGNHRVAAMLQAGYDKPVPVKLTRSPDATAG